MSEAVDHEVEAEESPDVDDPILEVDGLKKSFGGLVATDDVSIAVERGSITGLIGPNGAGKSTLFNLISGFYEPDAGQVLVGDSDVTGLPPHEIVQRGLVRTFQTPKKLEGMSVREAMLVGPQAQPGESLVPIWLSPSSVADAERANLDRAEELLQLFEIDHLATERATEVSGGQLKLIELARAIIAEPDILLLDEPVAGVNPTLARKLAGFIEELNESYGLTFFIVEHDINFIMRLSDRIVVLDRGRVLTTGSPQAVKSDSRVIDAYLGGGGP